MMVGLDELPSWEPETTLLNLRLIRDARRERGEEDGWVAKVEEALAQAARELPGDQLRSAPSPS